MGDSRSFKSKEDLTIKISNSVFVTNFPDHFSAQDLWKVCNAYDMSCSQMGKIKDINALSNLYALLANKGFDKVNLTYLGGFWILIDTGSTTSKEKMCKHVGVASWFYELLPVNDSFVSEDRLVWVSVEGLPTKTWTYKTFTKIVSPWGSLSEVEDKEDSSLPYKKLCVITKPHILIDNKIKVIAKGRVYWIRVKELEAWSLDFRNYLSDNDTEEDELDDEKMDQGSGKIGTNCEIDKENEVDHVFESSCMNVNGVASENNGIPMEDFQTKKEGLSSSKSGNHRILNLKPGGYILEVMESVVEIGETMGYDMEGYVLANRLRNVGFMRLIGNISPFVGSSGGILCVWDPNMFIKDSVSISDSFFFAIRGTWVPTSTKLLIVSVCAPQELSKKRVLWEYIGHLIELWDGECVILAGLVDLPLEGYSFTWAYKSALKISKLDRFLISEGLLLVFPSLSAICLDIHLSDHRPILMRELVVDYAPTSFLDF
uniref:RNA-directed DNA polymerase, eukaryota, nucleotide-binding alpha-beta plait domain protein n=1 Tax=Tanacetum cinerariifolium TaxID=118510 RepID=A0A699GXG6_TANCI|nr:RNA-directed DNA polymerase, eukaryota, nucleotide-binding alpha-beta plait domain protein [Tanacetum cinerariifolium]